MDPLPLPPPSPPPATQSLLEYMKTFESADDQPWFLQLLTYPQLYQDSDLGVPDLTGARIVDKLIVPNANWELALSFIQNMLKVGEGAPLTDDWKKRGLEVGSKQEFKDKREELMWALYPAEKDYSKPLLTDAFNEELVQFRNSFGFMERQNDIRTLKETHRNLFKLLLQDPLSTLECVLPLSLRTAQFHVLEESLPAFKLKPKNMTRTFGEEALLRSLKELKVDDRTWDSLHSLVTQGFFRFEALNEILRLVTIDVIKEEDLERAEKLVRVYCDLVAELRTTLSVENIEKCIQYLQFLVAFTRAGLRTSNSNIMFTIRDLCLAASAQIPGGTEYGVQFDPTWSKTEDKIKLAIAYVRVPELRDRIGHDLEKMDWDLKEVCVLLLHLLENSSSLELPGCYEFYLKMNVPFRFGEKEDSNFINRITRAGIYGFLPPLTLLQFLTCHVQELQKNPAFETNVLGHLDLIETMVFIILGKVNLLRKEVNMDETLSTKEKQRLVSKQIDSEVPIVETLQEILEFVGWIEERYDLKSETEETDSKLPIQIAYNDAIQMLERIPKVIRGFWRVTSYQAHMTIILKKLGGVPADTDSSSITLAEDEDVNVNEDEPEDFNEEFLDAFHLFKEFMIGAEGDSDYEDSEESPSDNEDEDEEEDQDDDSYRRCA